MKKCPKPQPELKTYALLFTHKYGNGYALVNAHSPNLAESIFKTQTKYDVNEVTQIQELRWFGLEMQLVTEGRIVTYGKSLYDLAVYNGFKGTLEEFLESMKGPKGDTGEQGPQGPPGITVETDPIFSASPAATITDEDIDNWNNPPISNVQSDWNLSNSAAADYIKNKPDVNKVKQTKKSGSTAFPVLISAQGSPTSGNNYEAAYDSSMTFKPSTDLLSIKNDNNNVVISPSSVIIRDIGSGVNFDRTYLWKEGVSFYKNGSIGSISITSYTGRASGTEKVLMSTDVNNEGASKIGYKYDTEEHVDVTVKDAIDNIVTSMNTYCPIIKDTRSSNVPNITGVAPFSTLEDGQRIVLKVNKVIPNSPTITLTLSGGNDTPAIPAYSAYQNTVTIVWGNAIQPGMYVELIYESTNNRWMMVGNRDSNTIYPNMAQVNIGAGTSTSPNVISPKLFHDNAYIVEESYSSGSLKANKMYDFGTVSTALTIPTLDATNDLVSNALNFYALHFIAGVDNLSITFPTGVVVDDTPTINTGDYVEIMINKYGTNYYASIKVWQAQ